MAQNQESSIDEILSTICDKTFSKDDWNEVVRACKSLSAEWRDLSIFLGLSSDVIERIKNDNCDSKKCLDKALLEWVKQNYPTRKYGFPSWRTLLKAVADVNQRLCRDLASKHQITSSSKIEPVSEPETVTSKEDSSSVGASASRSGKTGIMLASTNELMKLLKMYDSQDSRRDLEKTLLKEKERSTPIHRQFEGATVSSKLSRDLALDNKFSAGATAASVKSQLRREMPDGDDDSKLLSTSKVNYRHTRKHVHSFPCIQRYTESLAQPDHSSCPPIQFVKGEPVHNEAMHKVTSDPNKTRPMVNFSLRFHHDQSKLTVHLKEARNLPKECRKECDPFVVLHLEPDREDTFQTKVHKSTNRPEFNKIFQFEGLSAERVKDQRLVFRFFNHALGNKPIGKVCHPLNEEVLKASASSMREEIACTEETNSYQGDLLLSLEYNPLTPTLAGTVCKATGLTKHDMFGKSDPYVKVVISYYDTIVHKCRTTVQYKTLAPVYNEIFSYNLEEEMNDNIDKITTSFFVIDYDTITRNDVMGVVNISNEADTDLGRTHWRRVMQSPGQEVRFWHPIRLATPTEKQHMRSRSPSPSR